MFAVLDLKTFFKTDYPGVAQLLSDFAEIFDDLGLKAVPHDSNLFYAEQWPLINGSSLSCSAEPPRPQPTEA